jgi:uridine phosphorylase
MKKMERKFQMNSPFTAADLPLDDRGRIYHLQVKPENLAQDILIVGDPGRAEMIGNTFLTDIEIDHEHRGLRTVTGKAKLAGTQHIDFPPLRTTVTTSGMGTPSLEIILQELVALNEIDFETRLPKAGYPELHIIRVGTSGALQKTTPLGTSIITSYAIGMEYTGQLYEVPCPDDNCARIEKELYELLLDSMPKDSRFYGKIHPYVTRANPMLVDAMQQAASLLGVPSKVGLTVSCDGFFAAQGRDVSRLKPSISDLDQLLSQFNPGLGGQMIENMEMEASFLNHFMNGLGYPGASVCNAIANRQANTFDSNYQESIKNTINIALLALSSAR